MTSLVACLLAVLFTDKLDTFSSKNVAHLDLKTGLDRVPQRP